MSWKKSTALLIICSIQWLIGRLIDWLIDNDASMDDWLIDWLKDFRLASQINLSSHVSWMFSFFLCTDEVSALVSSKQGRSAAVNNRRRQKQATPISDEIIPKPTPHNRLGKPAVASPEPANDSVVVTDDEQEDGVENGSPADVQEDGEEGNESNGAEEVYEVEAIVAKRKVRNEWKYQLKWVGYADPTWEPVRALNGSQELLEEFEREYAEKARQKTAAAAERRRKSTTTRTANPGATRSATRRNSEVASPVQELPKARGGPRKTADASSPAPQKSSKVRSIDWLIEAFHHYIVEGSIDWLIGFFPFLGRNDPTTAAATGESSGGSRDTGAAESAQRRDPTHESSLSLPHIKKFRQAKRCTTPEGLRDRSWILPAKTGSNRPRCRDEKDRSCRSEGKKRQSSRATSRHGTREELHLAVSSVKQAELACTKGILSSEFVFPLL